MRHDATGRFVTTLAALGALVSYGPPIAAHHSTAEYDANAFAEARGEVVSVLWRNPHVRFQVSTKSLDGTIELWEIESADLTRLDRAGLPRDILKVGDVVTFAGNPSTRRERRMYVTNLLVADGREILLRGNVKARWAPDRVVSTDLTPAPATTAAAAADNASSARSWFPRAMGRRPLGSEIHRSPRRRARAKPPTTRSSMILSSAVCRRACRA